MSNKDQNENKYDLKERTCIFGEEIVKFAKKIPKNVITLPIIGQLIKSSTSIGANYRESDCAESKADFIHKIGICAKESSETIHWLRMVLTAVPEMIEETNMQLAEATELNLIFNAIRNSSQKNNKSH